MPRHRPCQLPQRIGEDVGQHQVERAAAANSGAAKPVARITRTWCPDRSAWRSRRRPGPRAGRCRRPAPLVQRLRSRDRQHAGAGAEIEHAARAAGFQDMVEQQQAAARGAVVAGAEGERRLDLDGELVGRHAIAVMLPWTTKRPAGTGTRSSRLALTQSLASIVSKAMVSAISFPGRVGNQFAHQRLVRRVGKMQRDVPVSVRPLERGDRGIVLQRTPR